MAPQTVETMHNSPVRRTKLWAIGASLFALCYLIWIMLPTSGWVQEGWISDVHLTWGAETSKKLVPLEAHIMSKSGDARDCLRELAGLSVLPTMQKVLDKVDFTLSYIGTPTNNDGVSCKHGPEECMGNIIELCAAELYPDPKTYLGFTMCLARDYQAIPQQSLVEDCALEHNIDFSKLNECAVKDDGGHAMETLRNSVRRSIDAGVVTSCTVRLNEEIYCIRDGGEWRDCPHGSGVNDLVLAVEKLYQASCHE
ncbi:hypothetical protein BJ878DRAFT_533159 [Calycina marina]|uniref:Uncharacterized protein n=1 Tax=Calycina marina TaxID=1763456 RepID=A0A9P7Z711_9HELO|nr:hypothetical protein BJ878DRAFT_533159 [Calycina marina]